jgi:hypothetical protein
MGLFAISDTHLTKLLASTTIPENLLLLFNHLQLLDIRQAIRQGGRIFTPSLWIADFQLSKLLTGSSKPGMAERLIFSATSLAKPSGQYGGEILKVYVFTAPQRSTRR